MELEHERVLGCNALVRLATCKRHAIILITCQAVCFGVELYMDGVCAAGESNPVEAFHAQREHGLQPVPTEYIGERNQPD